MEEIEVKILEIDPASLTDTLLSLGAKQEFDLLFEAIFLDLPDGALRLRGDLLRLRREGEQAVLTHKRMLSQEGAKVMQETESAVADFEAMKQVFLSLGYEVTKQTRKRRVQFALNDCHLVIDDYEGDLAAIPPFLEIEAPSRNSLAQLLDLLNISPSETLPWSTFDLARHYGLDS